MVRLFVLQVVLWTYVMAIKYFVNHRTGESLLKLNMLESHMLHSAKWRSCQRRAHRTMLRLPSLINWVWLMNFYSIVDSYLRDLETTIAYSIVSAINIAPFCRNKMGQIHTSTSLTILLKRVEVNEKTHSFIIPNMVIDMSCGMLKKPLNSTQFVKPEALLTYHSAFRIQLLHLWSCMEINGTIWSLQCIQTLSIYYIRTEWDLSIKSL